MQTAIQEQRLELLRRINENAVVQHTMGRIANTLLSLLHSIALDASLGQYQMLEALLRHEGLLFLTKRYHIVMLMLTCKATTQNNMDSGSVKYSDVIEALVCGNIRERCTILMNLLFKDRDGLVMHWIMNRSPAYNPHFLNMCVVSKYRSYFSEEEYHCMQLYRQRLQRRGRNLHQRTMRTLEERELYRLQQQDAVPVLSSREKKVVPDEKALSWKTGHMNWKLPHTPLNLECAMQNGNEIMCGVSGHTDLLLTFGQVFACYDLQVFTLIALVWLVGSDHHSLCEVLLAAREHGLEYEGENAIHFVNKLLNDVECRYGNQLCGPSCAFQPWSTCSSMVHCPAQASAAP